MLKIKIGHVALIFLIPFLMGSSVILISKAINLFWDKLAFGGTFFLVFVGGGVCLLSFEWLVATIGSYQKHVWIKDIVGVHPNELPLWKWRKVADPVALREMKALASQLRDLVEKENSLFKSEMALVKDVLDLNNEIERRKKEFSQRLSLYRKFGIEFTDEKWENFDCSTAVKPENPQSR